MTWGVIEVTDVGMNEDFTGTISIEGCVPYPNKRITCALSINRD